MYVCIFFFCLSRSLSSYIYIDRLHLRRMLFVDMEVDILDCAAGLCAWGGFPFPSAVFLVLLFLTSCESKQATSPRFNHVMLSVSNLEASIKFYTSGFDLQVTNQLKKIEVFNDDGTTLSRDVNMAFLKFPDQNFVLELSETPNINSENPSPFYQHFV